MLPVEASVKATAKGAGPLVGVALKAAPGEATGVVAVIVLVVARFKLFKAPYPELTTELKKDHEWLKNLDVSSRPTN